MIYKIYKIYILEFIIWSRMGIMENPDCWHTFCDYQKEKNLKPDITIYEEKLFPFRIISLDNR